MDRRFLGPYARTGRLRHLAPNMENDGNMGATIFPFASSKRSASSPLFKSLPKFPRLEADVQQTSEEVRGSTAKDVLIPDDSDTGGVEDEVQSIYTTSRRRSTRFRNGNTAAKIKEDVDTLNAWQCESDNERERSNSDTEDSASDSEGYHDGYDIDNNFDAEHRTNREISQEPISEDRARGSLTRTASDAPELYRNHNQSSVPRRNKRRRILTQRKKAPLTLQSGARSPNEEKQRSRDEFDSDAGYIASLLAERDRSLKASKQTIADIAARYEDVRRSSKAEISSLTVRNIVLGRTLGSLVASQTDSEELTQVREQLRDALDQASEAKKVLDKQRQSNDLAVQELMESRNELCKERQRNEVAMGNLKETRDVLLTSMESLAESRKEKEKALAEVVELKKRAREAEMKKAAAKKKRRENLDALARAEEENESDW